MTFQTLLAPQRTGFVARFFFLFVSFILITSSVPLSAAEGHDITAPTVLVTSPAAGSTVSGESNVVASASDDVGVVGVFFALTGPITSTFDDTTAPYGTTLSSTQVPDGTYTLTATARDAANNTASHNVTFTIQNTPGNTTDATAPTVSITAPVNGSTVSGSISLSATASDNVAISSVQFKVDGTNVGSADTSSPYGISLDTTTLSNGNHVVTAIATDSSGNSATSSPVTFNVNNAPVADTTSPAVLITQPLNNTYVYGSSYNASADASDNVGVVGVQFKVDGSNVGSEDTTAPYNAIISPSALSDGPHTLTATARDAAGNTGVYSIVFNIDNDFSQGPPPFPEQTPPIITIHAPVGTYSSYPVLFHFTINEPGNCTYALDNVFSQRFSMVPTNASRVAFTASNAAILNGNHTVTAICTDLTGNLKFSDGNFSVDVASGGTDTTNPTVSITSPSNGATVSGTIALSASASDNVAVSQVQFRIDGTNVGSADTTAPYSTNFDTTTLSNGNHVVTAVATDSSGNQATSSSVTITVSNGGADTTAPIVSITSPSSGSTVSGTISITATASDNVAVSMVQFKIEGSNIGSADTSAPYSASLDTTILPNGNYVLTAIATDSSGNQATSSPISIAVSNSAGGDTSSPSVSITSPVNGSTVSGAVPVSATASDNVGVVGVTFVLDGNTAGAIDDTSAPYETSLQSTLIADGIHTLTATARDAAGNTKVASVQFTVNNNGGSDTTNPTVSITSPSNGSTVSGTIALSASASDDVAVSSVQFKVDGSNVGSADASAPYSVTLDTTTLSNGTHLITATATDTSGNQATSSPVSVTVANAPSSDTTFPTVTITSPLSGAVISGESTVSADASDNVGVIGVFFSLIGPLPSTFDDTSAPYGTTLSSTQVPDGTYTLTATARDAANNTASHNVTFIVRNNPSQGDTLPPSVSLTSPAQGATLVGNVTLAAQASDESGIAFVRFQVDGITLAGSQDTSAPYTFIFDSTSVSNGTHTLTAVAFDTVGNQRTSSSVTVTVANPGAGSGADTTGPSIVVYSPQNSTYNSSLVMINFTASDPSGVSLMSFTNDTGVTQYTAPLVQSVTEGSHVWTFTAQDSLGNTRTQQVTFVVNTSLSAPSFSPISLVIVSPASTVYASSQVLVNLSTSNATLVTYTIDNGSIRTYTVPLLVTLSTGNHTLVAQASNPGYAAVAQVNFSIVLPTVGNQTTCTQPNATLDRFVYFTCPTLPSGAIVDQTFIEMNTTTIPAGIGNVTTRLYNGSHHLIEQDTAPTYFGEYNRYAGLPYGVYYYNASIIGDHLNSSYFTTETRNITLANLTVVPPVVVMVPPAPITDLHAVAVFEHSITWAWDNPNQTDLAHTQVYLDGVLVASTTEELFTAGSLGSGTTHIIAVRTVDVNGTVNTDAVFDVQKTLGDNAYGNLTAPLILSGLTNASLYPTMLTAQGTGCPAELFCGLYLDGVSVPNPHTVTLSEGMHTFIFYTEGNHNYSEMIVLQEVNVTRDTRRQFATSSSVMLQNGTNEVVFTSTSNTTEIVIPSSVASYEELRLNLALLANNGVVTMPRDLTLVRQTSEGTYTAFIRAGTVLSALGWDGRFFMPMVANATSFTVPSGSVDVVLNMGVDGELLFSQPVKVVLGGMAGKHAAWSSGNGSATPITLTCANIDAPANLNTSSARECVIDAGTDLVIWTYHFTTFGAYTPASAPASSGGSGGSSSGGSSSSSSGGSSRPVSSPLIANASSSGTISSVLVNGTTPETTSQPADETSTSGLFSGITGAVTGSPGALLSSTFAIGFIVVILLGLAFLSIHKLRKKHD